MSTRLPLPQRAVAQDHIDASAAAQDCCCWMPECEHTFSAGIATLARRFRVTAFSISWMISSQRLSTVPAKRGVRSHRRCVRGRGGRSMVCHGMHLRHSLPSTCRKLCDRWPFFEQPGRTNTDELRRHFIAMEMHLMRSFAMGRIRFSIAATAATEGQQVR